MLDREMSILSLFATLIPGVIWGFWNLPKFLPYAIILTWLYNSTDGNLLLVLPVSHKQRPNKSSLVLWMSFWSQEIGAIGRADLDTYSWKIGFVQ